MEVLFATRELVVAVAKRASRIARFGLEGAMAIDLRLQQLWAAPNLAHMRHLPGRCRELHGDPDGRLAVDAFPHRLLFRPVLEPVPRLRGQLDWSAVDRIAITEIVRHD